MPNCSSSIARMVCSFSGKFTSLLSSKETFLKISIFRFDSASKDESFSISNALIVSLSNMNNGNHFIDIGSSQLENMFLLLDNGQCIELHRHVVEYFSGGL